MTNAGAGKLLMREVLRAISDTYDWPDPMQSVEQDRTAVTPAIITRFVGTYRVNEITFEITVDGMGGLTLSWKDGYPSESLLASPDGLFATDTGTMLTTKDTAAVSAKTLIFIHPTGDKFEAARIVP